VRYTAFLALFVRLIYGGYTWFVVVCVTIPTIVALAIAPRLRTRRRIAQLGARTIFYLIGSPVSVHGPPIEAGDPAIVVANHASYLDGVILTAVLPTRFTFLIKQEMRAAPIVGFILQRLGSEFVDRGDVSQRHRIGRRLVQAAHQGKALAVFPEGTFDEQPGLKPFRPGAFRAAYRADTRIWPTAIVGARHKFPAGRILAAPGPLRVRVCKPLDPGAFDSHEQLMRATRAALLEHLDEPDLDGFTSQHSEAPRPLRAAASEYSEPDP